MTTQKKAVAKKTAKKTGARKSTARKPRAATRKKTGLKAASATPNGRLVPQIEYGDWVFDRVVKIPPRMAAWSQRLVQVIGEMAEVSDLSEEDEEAAVALLQEMDPDDRRQMKTFYDTMIEYGRRLVVEDQREQYDEAIDGEEPPELGEIVTAVMEVLRGKD